MVQSNKNNDNPIKECTYTELEKIGNIDWLVDISALNGV